MAVRDTCVVITSDMGEQSHSHDDAEKPVKDVYASQMSLTLIPAGFDKGLWVEDDMVYSRYLSLRRVSSAAPMPHSSSR